MTERLRWKCRKNAVEIIEVLGKGLGAECSRCGAVCETSFSGKYGAFKCQSCGYEEDRKVNAARNAINRGKTGRQLNKVFPTESL